MRRAIPRPRRDALPRTHKTARYYWVCFDRSRCRSRAHCLARAVSMRGVEWETSPSRRWRGLESGHSVHFEWRAAGCRSSKRPSRLDVSRVLLCTRGETRPPWRESCAMPCSPIACLAREYPAISHTFFYRGVRAWRTGEHGRDCHHPSSRLPRTNGSRGRQEESPGRREPQFSQHGHHHCTTFTSMRGRREAAARSIQYLAPRAYRRST
jgi:hypothetical protein